MTDRQAFRPPTPSPCSECPWRVSNRGRANQHGFYTARNLARLWSGLRRGQRMTCHPTDPHMSDFAGYEDTAVRTVTHECAGAAILVQRELARFQDAAHAAESEGQRDAFRRYRAGRKKTMTFAGLQAAVTTYLFGAAPPPFGDGLPTRKMDLNEPDVQYEPLGEWSAR
jgi:hypothetical protein